MSDHNFISLSMPGSSKPETQAIENMPYKAVIPFLLSLLLINFPLDLGFCYSLFLPLFYWICFQKLPQLFYDKHCRGMSK